MTTSDLDIDLDIDIDMLSSTEAGPGASMSDAPMPTNSLLSPKPDAKPSSDHEDQIQALVERIYKEKVSPPATLYSTPWHTQCQICEVRSEADDTIGTVCRDL